MLIPSRQCGSTTTEMASSPSRIRVREATQADAPAITEIHFAAFGRDVISQLMYPTVSQDARDRHTASIFPSEASDGKKLSETITMVAELLPEDAAVNARGEVVAFGKWMLRRQPVPEEEWNVETPVTSEMLGEGSNAEVYNWFIAALHRRYREIARGDAHLCKCLLSLVKLDFC